MKKEPKFFMIIIFLEALFLKCIIKEVDSIILMLIITATVFVIYCYCLKKYNKRMELLIMGQYTFAIILLLLIIDEIIPNIKEISTFVILIYIAFGSGLIVVFSKYIKTLMLSKKINKENSVNIDKLKYYRDIINKYSPAELSYIYNKGNKKYSDILISTLISLSLNQYIKIDNSNKIVVIKDNFEKLSQNEKYILNCIKSNKKSIDLKI